MINKDYCKTYSGGFCEILQVHIHKDLCNSLCKGNKKAFAAGIKKAKTYNRISRLISDCLRKGIDKDRFKTELKGLQKKEKKLIIIRAAKEGVDVDQLIVLSRELGLE